MTEYYSKVKIYSAGASVKVGPFKAATISGSGDAKSNDLPSLRTMSKELVSAVDSNNERVYKLIK